MSALEIRYWFNSTFWWAVSLSSSRASNLVKQKLALSSLVISSWRATINDVSCISIVRSTFPLKQQISSCPAWGSDRGSLSPQDFRERVGSSLFIFVHHFSPGFLRGFYWTPCLNHLLVCGIVRNDFRLSNTSYSLYNVALLKGWPLIAGAKILGMPNWYMMWIRMSSENVIIVKS